MQQISIAQRPACIRTCFSFLLSAESSDPAPTGKCVPGLLLETSPTVAIWRAPSPLDLGIFRNSCAVRQMPLPKRVVGVYKSIVFAASCHSLSVLLNQRMRIRLGMVPTATRSSRAKGLAPWTNAVMSSHNDSAQDLHLPWSGSVAVGSNMPSKSVVPLRLKSAGKVCDGRERQD